jgi:hypothetical protein
LENDQYDALLGSTLCHTAVDHAHVLKDLADFHFASAKTIVLIQDNLSIQQGFALRNFSCR